MPPTKVDLAIRFAKKVGSADPVTGCRLWLGAHSIKGRGLAPRPVFWIGYANLPGEPTAGAPQLIVPAARVALSLHDGVPLHERDGLDAAHACNNPLCVEATHLAWETRLENMATWRSPRKKRDFGSFLPVRES